MCVAGVAIPMHILIGTDRKTNPLCAHTLFDSLIAASVNEMQKRHFDLCHTNMSHNVFHGESELASALESSAWYTFELTTVYLGDRDCEM